MNWGVEDLLEVKLAHDEDFLKVKETLTRIGIASRHEHKLFQSCHILHKRGRYYIVHFKELFALDGKQFDLTENDIARRNMIADLLDEWGLVELVDPDKISDNVASMNQIKIIPFAEKDDWTLVPKYSIGRKR